MRAPNRPSTTGTPASRSRPPTSRTRDSATSGRAAARKSGRRPRRVSASSVNWETSRQAPPVPTREWFSLPRVVVEDAEVEDLLGEVPAVVGPVALGDPQQGDDPPVDSADHLRVGLDRGFSHALEQGPHAFPDHGSIPTAPPSRASNAGSPSASRRPTAGARPSRPSAPPSRAPGVRGRRPARRRRSSRRARRPPPGATPAPATAAPADHERDGQRRRRDGDPDPAAPRAGHGRAPEAAAQEPRQRQRVGGGRAGGRQGQPAVLEREGQRHRQERCSAPSRRSPP